MTLLKSNSLWKTRAAKRVNFLRAALPFMQKTRLPIYLHNDSCELINMIDNPDSESFDS